MHDQPLYNGLLLIWCWVCVIMNTDQFRFRPVFCDEVRFQYIAHCLLLLNYDPYNKKGRIADHKFEYTTHKIKPMFSQILSNWYSRNRKLVIFWSWRCMMTSSNGNFFRVAGLLCGEFTGHRDLRHHRAHYDVSIMVVFIVLGHHHQWWLLTQYCVPVSYNIIKSWTDVANNVQ